MCRAVCVLGFLALYVRLAHSWDIVVSLKEQLVFYTNGIKTNTVNLISQNPTALVYDELHNMILYVDKESDNDAICGYNLSSKENKCFINRNGRNIHGLAFDPVTETIFFTDTNERSINSISLKPGSNNSVYGNLLFKLENRIPTNIAVDGCRKYIYWTNKITKNNNKRWERARFNGSETKVFSTGTYFESFSLAIDLQTQEIFNFYFCVACNPPIAGYIYSFIGTSDLNGKNDKSILRWNVAENLPKVLTVSKDYIYYTMSSDSVDSVWQLTKNVTIDEKPREIIKFDSESTLGIIAKFKIEDQIKGIQDCGSLSSLIPTTTVAPVHTGERSDTSLCKNYCLQGDCSFNDEGFPECSCDAGYSGNRCQVYACYGYCSNNGTCSLNENSEPKCSCGVGYSGPRCEVNVCQGYCLNNGDCSLNEENEPVCQCDGNHEGPRCEADINDTTNKCDAANKNGTLAYLLSILRKPSPKMYLTVEL